MRTPSAATKDASAPQPVDHDEQLYEEIRACTHWQDVLEVVADEGPGMSVKRAVQAAVRVNALVKASPSRNEERAAAVASPHFAPLLQLLHTHLPRMKPSQVSATATTLSQLSVPASPELLSTLCTAISSKALLFSAHDISTLLHATVQLGAQPSTSTLDRLGYRAHLLLQNQLLVKRPTGSLALQEGPSSSSNPPDDALSGPPPASTSTSPPSPLGSTTNTLTSLDEPTTSTAATSSTASATTTTSSSHQHGALPVSPSEPGFTPQGLAVLLHSTACLRYNNRQLLSSAAEVALQELSGFTPQGIANLLWAMGTLNFYFPSLVNACLGYVSRRYGEFRVQEAANVMWALTRLRHHPQESAGLLLGRMLDRNVTLQAADIAGTLMCLATFTIYPGKQAMAILSQRLDVLLSQPGGVGTRELCNCMWALSLLGESWRPAFIKVASELPARYEAGEMDEGLLRQSFQALLGAKMSEAEAKEEASFSGAAAPSPSEQRGGGNGSSSSNSSGAAAPGPRQAWPAAPPFPPVMLDAMRRSWVSSIQRGVQAAGSLGHASTSSSGSNSSNGNNGSGGPDGPTRPSPPPSSSFAASSSSSAPDSPSVVLSKLIGQLRVRHDVARTTKDGLVLIDIALRPSEDRYVALQVLRDFDHTRNTNQLLGSVQFERRILEKNGWEVRFLRFQDLMNVQEQARPFFVAELLKGMGCRVIAEPAGSPTGASGGGRRSGSGGVRRAGTTSEQVWEAEVALSDPKASKPQRRSSKQQRP